MNAVLEDSNTDREISFFPLRLMLQNTPVTKNKECEKKDLFPHLIIFLMKKKSSLKSCVTYVTIRISKENSFNSSARFLSASSNVACLLLCQIDEQIFTVSRC